MSNGSSGLLIGASLSFIILERNIMFVLLQDISTVLSLLLTYKITITPLWSLGCMLGNGGHFFTVYSISVGQYSSTAEVGFRSNYDTLHINLFLCTFILLSVPILWSCVSLISIQIQPKSHP